MDLNGPAGAPPAGVTPILDNPPNENGLAEGVLTACAAFATICLLIRGYGRVYLLRKFQTEEILVILAYGCFWGAIYSTYAMIQHPGYFVHTWNIRLKDIIPTEYYILVFGSCYTFVLPLLKVAIMVEWIRMFAPRGSRTKGYFWWGCVTVIFVQITANTGILIALNLQCIPHRAIYDFTVKGKCFDLFKLQVASASIQLISDVAIFLLPQHVIWTLKMTWRKRLGVSVIFGVGLLACVSAAFRLETTIAHGKSADAIFSLAPLVFWATAEMTCGFFVICLPCIPKILQETGAMRGIKRTLGMKTTGSNTNNRNDQTYGANGPSHHSKLTTSNSANAYYKLDEDGMPMSNLKGTESTEYLNKDGATRGIGITRTTRITVSQDV